MMGPGLSNSGCPDFTVFLDNRKYLIHIILFGQGTEGNRVSRIRKQKATVRFEHRARYSVEMFDMESTVKTAVKRR